MKEHRPSECQGCQKECTIHLTQIIEGKIKKIDMCEECPNSKNLQEVGGYGLMDELMQAKAEEKPVDYTGTTCPQCGMTESRFKKHMRFGCSQCYQTFDEQVQYVLSQTQKGCFHKGKAPLGMAVIVNTQKEINALKEELAQAVAQENYEEAAALRDSIAKLEAQAESPSGSNN